MGWSSKAAFDVAFGNHISPMGLEMEGERILQKGYELILNELLGVLKGLLAPQALEGVLRKVGSSLAQRQSSRKTGGVESRARSAARVLQALGGTATVEGQENKLLIRGGSCPLEASVSEHPEVCQIAEALVAEIVGAPVKERCDREGSPRCRFEIQKPV